MVDYEFQTIEDNLPIPFCYVAKNIQTGKILKHWIGKNEIKPRYPTDEKNLFIAFYSSAELGCHYVLNYEIPMYVLDLFTEFRCLTNGMKIPGNSLINACDFLGVILWSLNNSLLCSIDLGIFNFIV